VQGAFGSGTAKQRKPNKKLGKAVATRGGLCVYDVREIDVGIIKHRNPAVESQSLALGFPSKTSAEIAPDHPKLSGRRFDGVWRQARKTSISIEVCRI
jgi:hypothetical protein